MAFKKDAKIIGIWGGRGSGKSTRTKELIAALDRVIVVDPIGDYAKEKGFREFRTLQGMYRAIRAGWNTGFKCCLNLAGTEDPEATLLALSRDLFLIQRPYYEGKDKRKITLVVEEMSVLVPNITKAKNDRAFLQLCNLGRHYGVEIIGVSQRMAQVHTDFRGNTAEDYFFRLRAEVDYNSAAQLLGRAHVDTLRGLSAHQFIHFKDGEVKKGINDFLRLKHLRSA